MRKGPWQIQIIDDEIVILLAVRRAYRDKPVDIVIASNADQALAQMETFNFDLFLLDLDMKNGSGFQLLKKMTESFPDVPVILLTTGDIESETLIRQVEALRTLGCWHLLEKPFGYKKLVSFIERGLEERWASCNDPTCNLQGAGEQRRCRRFSRFEQINISLPDPAADGRIPPALATLNDISVGGLGITTRKKLDLYQEICFDEKFMHQTGIVVWSALQDDQSFRAGIRFS